MPPRIAFDLDGVLADFGAAYGRVADSLFPEDRARRTAPTASAPESREDRRQDVPADVPADATTDVPADEPAAEPAPERRPARRTPLFGAPPEPRLEGHPLDAGLLAHPRPDRPRRRSSAPRPRGRRAVGAVLRHAAAGYRGRHRAAPDPALARGAGVRAAERHRARSLPGRSGRGPGTRRPGRRHGRALRRRHQPVFREGDPGGAGDGRGDRGRTPAVSASRSAPAPPPASTSSTRRWAEGRAGSFAGRAAPPVPASGGNPDDGCRPCVGPPGQPPRCGRMPRRQILKTFPALTPASAFRVSRTSGARSTIPA